MNVVEIEEAITFLAEQQFDAEAFPFSFLEAFGKTVVPQEWFLVQLFVIDEVVEKIKDETIGDYTYDTHTATLIKN